MAETLKWRNRSKSGIAVVGVVQFPWLRERLDRNDEMKCYYHQARDAVGLCKSCNKGLCSDCATDVGNGLACRDRCEEQVRVLNTVVDFTVRTMPATESAFRGTRWTSLGIGLLSLIAGVIFVVVGVSDAKSRGAILFGAVLIGFSLIGLAISRRSARFQKSLAAKNSDRE